MDDVYFEVMSASGKKIRTTRKYWEFIIAIKHPSMTGKEDVVKITLKDPVEIRKSKHDEKTYLYYRKHNGYFCCVVCKHENGKGYIITAYITDKIKEGGIIWKK
ncbi:MAG: DUF4258 domain-containing protein [Candidatus Aenigmarchaeota archaeon]|nr:DUF4258 domain-containing protein [Candidatus Aenigmarchaeota archaeon]